VTRFNAANFFGVAVVCVGVTKDAAIRRFVKPPLFNMGSFTGD
jgi:hypothetical protein